MDTSLLWPDATFVIFDSETTGKYPLEAQLCELAAIKWEKGEVVDEFQSLLKPSHRIPDEVIAIHHISNEMLVNAPPVQDKINEFHRFVGEAIPVAHHVPFDLGFIAPEFERARLPLPNAPVLCTSLLSRALISEAPNHRLATLVKHLGLNGGQAHRALDDSRACLELFMKILERIGPDATIEELIGRQGVDLRWRDYSLQNLRTSRVMVEIFLAIEEKRALEIVYQGGSRPGQARTVLPMGIVRNHQGDFLVAREETEASPKKLEEVPKRYFLTKITAARS
ncbi:MAG: exonuclease [Bdellovibrionales bacterium]|nr:exonuclease [Bdellovibrionales bacterium]